MRTEADPVHGSEDWSKLMRECIIYEELLLHSAKCVTCGGTGDVWESDYTGDQTLIPCPDCFGGDHGGE